MNYKVAKAAAGWWVQQMTKRCKQLYPDKITGDNSNLVVVDDSLQDELTRFEKLLAEEILYYVEKPCPACFTCYHLPNYELSKIAKKASISTTYFPVRAEMRVFGKSVEVAFNGEKLRPLTLPAE